MALTTVDIERMVRKNSRNAMTSGMYTSQEVYDAFFLAAEEWNATVKPNRTLTTLTLTQGSAAVPTLPTAWTPDRTLQCDLMLSGQVIRPGLDFVPLAQLRQRQWQYGTPIPAGQPSMIGLPDASSGATAAAQVDVLPDSPYVINLWWWTPFVAWNVSNNSTGSFPDEQIRIICAGGAPYYLQRNEPENEDRCEKLYQWFLDKAQQFSSRNVGGRGGQVEYKDAVEPRWNGPFYPRGN